MTNEQRAPGSWIRDEGIAQSNRTGETFVMLKHWIFTIVHRAMREVYGENYSIRCLEASSAIHLLLNQYGLSGPIVMGAVCIAQITPDPQWWGWSGFWGKDHHFWTVTKFHEIVDLSIAQNHLHPVTSRHKPYPTPAIWWGMQRPWAKVMNYLPYGLVGEVQSTNEPHLQAKLHERVIALEQEMLRQEYTAEEIRCGFIAESLDCLQHLAREGDAWAAQSHLLQNAPLPEWVEKRKQELAAGMLETSRLPQPEFTKSRRM